MTKKVKALLIVCLTLCMGAFAFMFTACGGNQDGGENFNGTITVTVKYPDETPVTGNIAVQLCEYTNYEANQTGSCLRGVRVDENGTAVISGVKENMYYEIHLEGDIPTGYKYVNCDTKLGVYTYTVYLTAE